MAQDLVDLVTGLDPASMLIVLFLASALASTLFPLQSEAVLAAALFTAGVAPWQAVAVATLGNTIGGQINWALGRYIHRFKHRRWFPATPAQLDRAEGWYRRWGVWSLLLCWTPFLGDPLTVVAGVLRTPFWLFTALTAAARLARYVLAAWALLSI